MSQCNILGYKTLFSGNHVYMCVWPLCLWAGDLVWWSWETTHFERWWVQIRRCILDCHDILFTLICCKIFNDVCLKRPKINEKESRVGPFKKVFAWLRPFLVYCLLFLFTFYFYYFYFYFYYFYFYYFLFLFTFSISSLFTKLW